MLNVLRSPVLRYGFAVASVIVATLLRLALNPALGKTNVPYITYFLAVIITAWALFRRLFRWLSGKPSIFSVWLFSCLSARR